MVIMHVDSLVCEFSSENLELELDMDSDSENEGALPCWDDGDRQFFFRRRF